MFKIFDTDASLPALCAIVLNLKMCLVNLSCMSHSKNTVFSWDNLTIRFAIDLIIWFNIKIVNKSESTIIKSPKIKMTSEWPAELDAEFRKLCEKQVGKMTAASAEQ